MAISFTNENGDRLTVNGGDIFRGRSGIQYLAVEVPGDLGLADTPGGGVLGVPRAGEPLYVLIERIHAVQPGNDESRAFARTVMMRGPAGFHNEIAGAFRSVGARGYGGASGFVASDVDAGVEEAMGRHPAGKALTEVAPPSPTVSVYVTDDTGGGCEGPWTVTIDLGMVNADPQDARYLAEVLLIAADQAERLARGEDQGTVAAAGQQGAALAAKRLGVAL